MSCLVMVRRASGPIAARPYPACRFSIALRSAPFRIRRRRPTFGETLIRAYRARAGVLAPARFARLIAHACARAREGSGAGALLPSASPALFASARVEATSGRRFLPPHLGMSVHGVKEKIRNISDILNKLQSLSPARRCRPRSAFTPKGMPPTTTEAPFSTREGPAARLSLPNPGPGAIRFPAAVTGSRHRTRCPSTIALDALLRRP